MWLGWMGVALVGLPNLLDGWVWHGPPQFSGWGILESMHDAWVWQWPPQVMSCHGSPMILFSSFIRVWHLQSSVGRP